MSWHPLERAALADALTAAGPGAATLCEGWATEHLAAHVVLRETEPLTAAGLAVPGLRTRTERRTLTLGDASATADGYATLVTRVRTGVPPWYPLALAGDAAQLVELHVHTEDVRRGELGAAAGSRTLSPAHADALWRRFAAMSRLLHARLGMRVLLVSTSGRRHVVGKGQEWVRLTGTVSDLILHGSGRGRATALEVAASSDDALARLDARHPR